MKRMLKRPQAVANARAAIAPVIYRRAYFLSMLMAARKSLGRGASKSCVEPSASLNVSF